MRSYISSLEKTMIETCRHFGLKAHTTEETGVWIEDSKIGAIGKLQHLLEPMFYI
jgi:lipoyl(octanoyl) transferase